MKKVIGLAIFALILSLGLAFNTSTVSAQATTVQVPVLTKYAGYGNQTFAPSANNVVLGRFTLATGSTDGAVIRGITVSLSESEASSITDLALKDSLTGEALAYVKAIPTTSNLFSINTPIVLPAGSSRRFDLVGNIKTTASLGAWVASVDGYGTSSNEAYVNTASYNLVFYAITLQNITIGSGTLTATVNVGNTPDSKIVVAGSAMQKVGSFKFTAQNTSFTIQDLRVKTFGESNSSSISSVTIKYKDAGGLEKTASQPLILSSAGGLATYTGLTAFIPQNTERDIDVYVDVSTIASGANSGALIIVSLDSSGGFKAFDSNGVVDTTLASQDLSSSVTSGKGTLVVRRSVPTLSSVQDYSEILMAGGNQIIGKVKISANPAGDIGWKKIVFNYTKSANITLNTLKLYNQAANTEISGTFSNPATGQLIFTTTNEEQIAAGSSVTYELRATVGGLGVGVDTVVVSIANTSTTGVTASASTAGATGPASPSFIWTDRSASAISGGTVHSLNTLDWTNDLMVKTLPLTIGSKSNYGIGDGTVTPPVVTPPTTDESALIAQLQALIAQLLEQLKAQGYEIDANGNLVKVEPTPTQPPLPIDFCYVWGKNLTIGATGPDVDALVRAMVREGFLVRAPGENIQGEDFNEILAEAVVKFQGKYGISPKSGFVGPKTRAQLGALYGGNCDSQTSSITLVSPNGGEVYRPGDTINVRWSPVGMPSGGFVKLSLLREDQIGIYDTLIVKYPEAGVNQCLFSATSSSDCVPINSGSVNVLLRSDIAPGKYKVQVSCFMWGAQNVCPGAEFAESVDVSDLSFTVSNSTPVSDATATVTGSPTLELIYDASQKSVVAGSTNAQLLSFNMITGVNDIKLNGVVVSISGVDPAQLSNLKLYADGVMIADGIGGTYTNSLRDYQFTIPQPLYIQGNRSINFAIRGGISATANGLITPTLSGILHDYGTTLSISGLGFSGNTLTIVPSTTPATYHPADTNRDGRVIISEVTAFVTRVGSDTYDAKLATEIWRRGEVYTYNVATNSYLDASGNGIAVTTVIPVTPSITITSPTSGQVFTAGSVVPIRWTSRNVSGATAVDVQTANGAMSLLSTSLTGNPGTYDFTLSSATTPGAYVARVRGSGGLISSMPFTVTVPTIQPTTIPTITFNINGQPYSSVSQLTAGTSMNLTWTSTGADYCEAKSGGSFEALWTGEKARTSGTQTITVPADMTGMKAIAIQCRNAAGWQISTAFFSVVAPVTATSPTVSTPSVLAPALSASLSQVYENKAGMWNTFAPGVNSVGKANDFVWNTTLTLGESKTIKSIDMNHNVGGEYWSSSNAGAYPLVIFVGGAQVNTAYGQTLGTYGAGTTNLTVYGQHERAYFSGGILKVTFTDNTTVSATVPGVSTFSPAVPAQTGAALDAMYDILQSMLKQLR